MTRRRLLLTTTAVLSSRHSLVAAAASSTAPLSTNTCSAEDHGFTMEPLGPEHDGVPPLEGCKDVYFVRHAEGIHNRDSREVPNFGTTLSLTEAYRDSPLTFTGMKQCDKLAEEVSALKVPPEIVIVSPLQRAIHTAQLGFRYNPTTPPPFLATELARERISVHTCDWRRPKSVIEKDFPFVDMSLIESEEDDMWLSKEMTPAEYDSDDCRARAAKLLHWLLDRPETTLAVVAHWVFYTHLFGLFSGGSDGGAALREKFGNAEMRRVRLCR